MCKGRRRAAHHVVLLLVLLLPLMRVRIIPVNGEEASGFKPKEGKALVL